MILSISELQKQLRVKQGVDPLFLTFSGVAIKLKMVDRLKMIMKKGADCPCCGAKGSHAHLVKSYNKDHTGKRRMVINVVVLAKRSNGKLVEITKDHIIPKSRGGKNTVSNYQPMCKECNQGKANWLPSEEIMGHKKWWNKELDLVTT